MLRLTALATVPVGLSLLIGCSGSSLSYDNEDALGDIPDAPEVVPREEVEDSPYAPPEDGEQVDTPNEEQPPTEEPPAEEPPQDDPQDEPPAEDPPEQDPVDEPDPTPPPPADTCPADMTCVDQFPYVANANTTSGTDQFDGYACAPGTSEAGPENVYRIEVTEPGFLAVTLWGMNGSTDIDAHILGSMDSNDCMDRGHWDAGSLLQPGTYYVVADSWSGADSAGAYSIRMHLTTFDALAGDGLTPEVMEYSLTAFDNAWRDGETSKLVYTVADFSMPSTQRRLWMFDLANGDLLFNEFVSHGEGSGDPNDITMVGAMSNINGSHMSSLGLMRAAETYYGSKGYSLRLDGLESGYNNNVRSRAIVIHEATYATQSFVNSYGYLGRSWGCPAVDPAVNAQIIDTMKNGGLYMSFFDDPGWLSNSSYL